MVLNLDLEVAALRRLSVAQLRLRYAEVFGETTKANHKTWLVKRIAWRLQALAHGGLSDRAQQRIAELANEADLRLFPPRPARPLAPTEREETKTTPASPRLGLLPGTILSRRYKGQNLQVKVLADGFEWAGAVYQSLSAVAKAITGSHCNGFLFFRLGKYGEAR